MSPWRFGKPSVAPPVEVEAPPQTVVHLDFNEPLFTEALYTVSFAIWECSRCGERIEHEPLRQSWCCSSCMEATA